MRPLLAIVLLVAAPHAATPAAQSRSWAEPAADLQRGTLEGVAVSAAGRLFLAPVLARLSDPKTAASAAQVWAVATDAAGSVFLGTGPDGRIVRRTAAGREAVLFATGEPMVTALAVLADGSVLAGTAPEGKIYRVSADGRGSVWCETGERYVWAILPEPDGSVLAATGERGLLLRIDATGTATTLFDAPEPHLVSLARGREGAVIAGSAGRGLVFQVDAEGHGLVLYDGELPEVSGLAVLPDGAVLAALLAPPQAAPRRPAVRLRLPESAEVGAAPDQVEDLEDRPQRTLEGVIEGLSSSESATPSRPRGEIVRIDPSGAVRELWRSSREAPFGLAVDARGRTLFGTGEPGRVWSLDAGGDVALLATLDEAQVTALSARGEQIIAATSNPAAAYRVEWSPREAGVYLSRPLDAGAPARWGTIRWRSTGPRTGLEFFTRTGNSASPDETWSAWGPALTDPAGSRIDNPDGRFLQWRLRLPAAAGGLAVSDVVLTYEPYNRPPTVVSAEVDGDRRAVRDRAVFVVEAIDPDDDPLDVRVQFRAEGAADWVDAVTEAVPDEPSRSTGDSGAKRETRRGRRLRWPTAEIAEGRYTIRVVASDRASNAPGDGAEAYSRTPIDLAIDRTPPTLSVTGTPATGLDVTVEDAVSDVAALEVLRDGRVLFRARPADGVYDQRLERFRIPAADLPAGGAWSLRARDAAGNVAEHPL